MTEFVNEILMYAWIILVCYSTLKIGTKSAYYITYVQSQVELSLCVSQNNWNKTFYTHPIDFILDI